MCRTVHAVLQTGICGIQMLVRVFMTVILMIENVIRMVLQTSYNFISFVLQIVSLIPICLVFLLTSRLKCFMCGGSGPCPVNRGGTCDCVMSFLAIAIIFFIFRATGVLDKIFYSLGYAKTKPLAHTKFVPTPGDITECSREDEETTTNTETPTTKGFLRTLNTYVYDQDDFEQIMGQSGYPNKNIPKVKITNPKKNLPSPSLSVKSSSPDATTNGGSFMAEDMTTNKWTTVFYYLI